MYVYILIWGTNKIIILIINIKEVRGPDFSKGIL